MRITANKFFALLLLFPVVASLGGACQTSRDLSSQRSKLIGHWRVVIDNQDMAWDLYISPDGDFIETIIDNANDHHYEIQTEEADYILINIDAKNPHQRRGFRLSENGLTGSYETSGLFGNEIYQIRYIDDKIRP